MPKIQRPVNIHKGYHAHVYFNAATVDFASSLCRRAGEKFGLQVGTVHRKPVGPHPQWSCQIIFSNKDFDAFIAWMEQHRNGLTVLVHGLTGDDLKDHTDHAYWLGDACELDLSIFQKAS